MGLKTFLTISRLASARLELVKFVNFSAIRLLLEKCYDMEEALDEIAPIKTFTVRSLHKFGLSDRTK